MMGVKKHSPNNKLKRSQNTPKSQVKSIGDNKKRFKKISNSGGGIKSAKDSTDSSENSIDEPDRMVPSLDGSLQNSEKIFTTPSESYSTSHYLMDRFHTEGDNNEELADYDMPEQNGPVSNEGKEVEDRHPQNRNIFRGIEDGSARFPITSDSKNIEVCIPTFTTNGRRHTF